MSNHFAHIPLAQDIKTFLFSCENNDSSFMQKKLYELNSLLLQEHDEDFKNNLIDSLVNYDFAMNMSPVQKIYTAGMIKCCQHGNLTNVKCLLDSPYSRPHLLINETENDAFLWPCVLGHIEIVKFFINSTDIPLNMVRAGFNCIDEGFVVAANSNKIEMVHYLLNSPELQANGLPQATIDAKDAQAFMEASAYGHCEMLGFLCAHYEEKRARSLPNKYGERMFLNALQRKNLRSMDYLIANHYVTLTDGLKKEIQHLPDIQEKFECAQAFKVLQSSLAEKLPGKKAKI